MIHEVGLRPVLERMTSLEQAGRELIAAANEAGGRDNITVLLFRLEEIGVRGGAAEGATAARGEQQTTEYSTFEGEAVPAPRQGVTRPEGQTRVRDEALRSEDVAHAVRAADEAEAAYRASGTVAMSAIRPRSQQGAAVLDEPPERTVSLPDGTPPDGPAPSRTRRRRRFPVGLIFLLAVLAMVLGGFWLATRAVYFVGADAQRANAVTIYRGLPIELPLGIDLYSRYAGSGVTLESIPPARRKTFTDHKLRSKDDAENLVIQLERGQLDS
jgi:protein phosphatase